MQRAFNKYGKDAFSFDVICECLEEELNTKECAWIEWFGTIKRNRGYNLVGGGHTNRAISEETRRKLSKAKKGTKMSMEARRKISESNKGRIFSAESIQKISRALQGKPGTNRGRKFSDEWRRKISEGTKGYKHTEEARRKMSEAKKGTKHTEEWKRHISQIQTGRKQSPEWCKHISEGKKKAKFKHSAESKVKMSEALKGYPAWNKGKPWSEEVKKRMSEGHKASYAKKKAKALEIGKDAQ